MKIKNAKHQRLLLRNARWLQSIGFDPRLIDKQAMAMLEEQLESEKQANERQANT